MVRFLITKVQQAGQPYWIVSFPVDRLLSRRGFGRKKFNSLQRAEEFKKEIHREWLVTGKIQLGLDRVFHRDVLRAWTLLSTTLNATLERAALVYLQCQSASEKRGNSYEVARNREITLSPRTFLMVQNEAQSRGVTLSEAVEGLLGETALLRAELAIRKQAASEQDEYKAIRKRNWVEERKLLEIRKQARIRKEFGDMDMMYEAGRRSVLNARANYTRKWRQKKLAQNEKETALKNGNGTGTGNRDMQRRTCAHEEAEAVRQD